MSDPSVSRGRVSLAFTISSVGGLVMAPTVAPSVTQRVASTWCRGLGRGSTFHGVSAIGSSLATHSLTSSRHFHNSSSFYASEKNKYNNKHLKASVTDTTAPVHDKKKGKGKKDKGGDNDDASNDGLYRNTVNLPKTEFEQRANATVREPQLQAFWDEQQIYQQALEQATRGTFVLHDGPPYANGALHMGHALNKVLKDIIVRKQLMAGKKALFIPGWDCHGLPIELKVLQSMSNKERQESTTSDLRKRAKEFALQTVELQKTAFKRLGVWGDWEHPYLTLLPGYEAKQLQVFGEMFLKGYIYRGVKPVHWSPSSRTALAEAELEYPEGHVSRSCYVLFPLVYSDKVKNEILDHLSANPQAHPPKNDSVGVAIWTTTPWTLPANRAVAVNADLDYALVQIVLSADQDNKDKQDDDQPQPAPDLKCDTFFVAKDLVSSVQAKVGAPLRVVSVVKGAQLAGFTYHHPVEDNKVCPVVIGGDYITTESGTGLVHTAPGHGVEDYQVGLREQLEILSPVDAAGRFTFEAANGKFEGQDVLKEGNQSVIDYIRQQSILIKEEPYKHKYPYDWRTKKPTIFRATSQWFASVEGFREAALDQIKQVKWTPAIGENRIRSMVEGRSDWCISRQRTWGVPIPAFYDPVTSEPVLDSEIITRVQEIVAEKGTDAWFDMDADEILPVKHRGKGLVKGTDTMDVWFDSGSSWASVVGNTQGLQLPANVYLEGSDQHRGWFQSSLLTSVAVTGKAPFENVITHGFVLDEKGIKMSKSIGNVVDPFDIINGGKNQKLQPPYGADTLRLWVASVDYSGDVLIGPGIIRQVSDTYRKLRNTLRYMLGSVYDFDPSKDQVAHADLPALDRYILKKYADLVDEIKDAYDSFAFYRIYQAMQRFAIVDMSNFYLDIAKDRLYISSLSAERRRSCQSTLVLMMDGFVKALAPILPHLAEDFYQNIPFKNTDLPKSIFMNGWIDVPEECRKIEADEEAAWEKLRELRVDVNRCLELARVDKSIGSSLDAAVVLYLDHEKHSWFSKYFQNQANNQVDELRYLFIVSEFEVEDSKSRVESTCQHIVTGKLEQDEEGSQWVIGVRSASGSKCDRCWNYSDSVGTFQKHPLLCDRCHETIVEMGFKPAVPAVADAVN